MGWEGGGRVRERADASSRAFRENTEIDRVGAGTNFRVYCIFDLPLMVSRARGTRDKSKKHTPHVRTCERATRTFFFLPCYRGYVN